MNSYRTDRELLLEEDPQRISENLQILSLKDADWRHQKAAMVAGYATVVELAVDELLEVVRSLEQRVIALEQR